MRVGDDVGGSRSGGWGIGDGWGWHGGGQGEGGGDRRPKVASTVVKEGRHVSDQGERIWGQK